MEILRTANAGVLIAMDGVRILLDGISREADPYPASPPEIRKLLMDQPPDAAAYTHTHPDHYDPDFPLACPLFGAVPGGAEQGTVGGVELLTVPTRHMGRNDVPHVSILLRGSRTVLFTGDASPLQWKPETPAFDVLIAPFAYASSPSGWKTAQRLGAQIVLVHMPERDRDPAGLWQAVESVTKGEQLYIPALGQRILLT